MADLPAGATFGSLVHAVLETADPLAETSRPSWRRTSRAAAGGGPVESSRAGLAAAMVPMHDTPLGPLADGLTLRQIGLADRLREMDFEIPLAGGMRDAAPTRWLYCCVGGHCRLTIHWRRMRTVCRRCVRQAIVAGVSGGSIDVVLRLPGQRSWWSTTRRTSWATTRDAADYGRHGWRRRCCIRTTRCRRCCIRVVLHRYLRWRLPGYDPERHLGGVMYLFVRGMCGPETPVVDGHPCRGVQLDAAGALVTELSDLLGRGRAAA